jgi:hypothetical protein
MGNEKKPYTTPQLIIHGKIEEITQQGGGNRIDLPMGTAISPDSTISSVTS